MTQSNVIVGAGQAGGWAAVGMREAGFQGRIVLIGEELWQPYERPPLSKTVLTAPEEPPIQYFHAPGRYEALGIELELGRRVETIDRVRQTVALRGGISIAYDRLLLTTGGSARSLPIPGGEHALLLRTLADARRIREALSAARRVVCIGAGVIGLEIASSARTRGCDVVVLEAAPRPLGRCLAPEAAAFVQRLHEQAGTRVRTGMAVNAIEQGSDGEYRVVCGGNEVFHADLVVAGVGMGRNVELAVQAGIEADNGIVVDEIGRTSVAGIFAAGDVAAFWHPFYERRLRLESWRHAQNHGIAVGKAMAGLAVPYDDIPWFWTDQHEVNLQLTGVPDAAARTIVREDDGRRFVALHLGADGSVVGVTAAGSPRDIRAGTALIRSRRRVDPGVLADPGVSLQQLARG